MKIITAAQLKKIKTTDLSKTKKIILSHNRENIKSLNKALILAKENAFPDVHCWIKVPTHPDQKALNYEGIIKQIFSEAGYSNSKVIYIGMVAGELTFQCSIILDI